MDRPNFNKVGWVVLDGARVCGSDLAAFVALHRCQSGQNDLVGALTPGGPIWRTKPRVLVWTLTVVVSAMTVSFD